MVYSSVLGGVGDEVLMPARLTHGLTLHDVVDGDVWCTHPCLSSMGVGCNHVCGVHDVLLMV